MAKETNIPPFMEEELNSFKQFKCPGVDMETLLSCYKKNMELMNTTQKIATEATQSVMELQKKYFKSVFDQMNEEVKSNFSKASFAEKAAHQANTAKITADETMKHVRDVSSIIAKSNEQVVESIQKRFKEILDESANQAKKSQEPR